MGISLRNTTHSTLRDNSFIISDIPTTQELWESILGCSKIKKKIYSTRMKQPSRHKLQTDLSDPAARLFWSCMVSRTESSSIRTCVSLMENSTRHVKQEKDSTQYKVTHHNGIVLTSWHWSGIWCDLCWPPCRLFPWGFSVPRVDIRWYCTRTPLQLLGREGCCNALGAPEG